MGGSVVLYFSPITSMHVFLSLDESSAFVEGARKREREREREYSQKEDVSGKHQGAQISSY